MDPGACRVMYIDERFNTERWISREGLSPSTPQRKGSQVEFSDLPHDLQTNVNAFLSVFNQVYVCSSGRSFSTKLSELHEQVKSDCTPILACFDVGSESKNEHLRTKSRFSPASDSPLPSPNLLRREITFSSESDESYGLQLLSRISSDLQVEEGVKLIIPVAIVLPKRKDSHDLAVDEVQPSTISRAPYGPEAQPVEIKDTSDIIDERLMLQCLDAGALDVVRSPLDKAGIMGLTVHAYRIYKNAKKEQAGFMALSRRGRKQSWVGVEDEKPYAYLREAMVKKLLKGICDPQNLIEDYQHRDLYIQDHRKKVVAAEVGKWSFCGHDFTEDELVYAGYYMLNHALKMPEAQHWRMDEGDILHFMQGCRVAYNSFVLYHNFRHAVDVLQSVFYFLVQIGILPPYPTGSEPPPHADQKSPIARLLGPFEALTLLIAAIGHDVGHPGVNNMFLVKLNAPLAQLYNDQSVLEAFHCAAYSQILRRHWPAAFQHKVLRKLMIDTILATDMGVHADYMGKLGNLQEKIHQSESGTDLWAPKDIEWARTLTCGLLIKCADISNVARPWAVAEKWTHLLQKEFAHQGEMEAAVGMETALFGGPPELGNMLKLANGQIGFMTIFAHPLFANVADIIPAMRFAADEILTNKGVWFTRAEHEKKMHTSFKKNSSLTDNGAVSPRTQSPVGRRSTPEHSHLPSSPLRARPASPDRQNDSRRGRGSEMAQPREDFSSSSLAAVAGIAVTEGDSTPRRLSASKTEPLAHTRRQSNLVNGEHGTSKSQNSSHDGADDTPDSSSTPRLQMSPTDLSDESVQALNDPRRDQGVSMRAGTDDLPVEALQEEKHKESSREELAKFNFATSKDDEPVRTYEPQRKYSAPDADSRASFPIGNTEHQKPRGVGADDTRQTHSALPTVPSPTPRGEGDDHDALTPSQSFESPSYISDKSEEYSHNKDSFQAMRRRAASAPLSPGSPNMTPSFSVGSNSATSHDSSKADVQATILSNGEVDESSVSRDRKASTRSVGRKRSKLKMGLAFWKRNRSEKSLSEEGRPESQDSSGR